MTRAALWARALLQERNERRIGIVVPKLHKERAAVAKIFDDVLCPARGLWAKEQRPYNISLAPALGRSPVIAAALGLLELTQDDPSLAKLACLLRSPFIAGSESEMAKRALLDAKLRDKGELICSWSLLARYAQEFAPILAQRLAALRQEFARICGAATTGEWAKVFRNLLQAAGWPGDRALNSEEHQALARWDKLLNEFSTLDSCLPRLGFHDAVVRLRRVTDDVLFQPESPELPVQILGLLEARGQTFDHLWVAGMHDEVWPAPCSPNPFLPLVLQRKFNLPHATPERELEHAKAALKGLLASADDVVLSWPRREGDVELHPSRLILEFPEASEIKLAQMTLYRDLIHNARQLEFFRDDRAPALAPGTFKRGSALFKNQAACPFKAFAEIRLRAQSLEELALGLSAADRGRLVHEVIGAIWDELKTYLALIAEPNLPGLVARAVAKVLAQAAKFRPHTFTTAFAALEERRLAALMLEWLELERARPPFGSVSCEVKKTENIGSVTVNLRVDRIDRFANGEIALVDYKTGECDVAGWDDERPEEPQLPLYAYGVENLAALSFAQLRRGEVKFAGLAAREGIAPGIKAAPDWQARITDWRRVLEELAQQFLSGAAQVDPKRFPHTCRNCDLPALCRIAERRADEHDD
jgi:ATP-dependent helicase/nuclease subunit B